LKSIIIIYLINKENTLDKKQKENIFLRIILSHQRRCNYLIYVIKTIKSKLLGDTLVDYDENITIIIIIIIIIKFN
jgi:hypothetical protein